MVSYSSTPKPDEKGGKSPRFMPPLLFLLTIAGIFFAIKWKDVVRQRDDGSWELQEWRNEETQKEIERNDEAEQYRLLAISSGYYPCYFCPTGEIWINQGETLKIGTTTNPSTRYTAEWLQRENVRYHTDTVGDLATVRREEIRKIATYPLWPENMRRPKDQRLVVPPFHRTMRLK